MKRLLIPVLLLLAGACTDIIDYDFSKVEPELMVLGWLDQSTSSQTVCVSLSEGGLIKSVEDATVTCYVNDRQVASVTAIQEEKDVYSSHSPFEIAYSGKRAELQLPVSFSASLKPGDKVRLTVDANHGTYQASTPELTVPDPVEITNVATSHVTVAHLDYSEDYLQIRADVPDRKGEDNWYCVSIQEVSHGTYYFKDDGPNLSVSANRTAYIHDLDDPILLDGNLSQSDLNIFDFSGNGEFACFSDQLFQDGTAHLKMNIPSWHDGEDSFRLLGKRLAETYFGTDMLNGRVFDKVCASCQLQIRLSQCSQDAYYYLRSLRTISSEGYDPRIVEPVTVPSNIIGGIGFVDIVNTAVACIDLHAREEQYPIEDPYI